MPARLGQIRKALRKYGCTVEAARGGSSHFKARTPDGKRTFILPSHNGMKGEISNFYIRRLCKSFGIDLEEFKRKL